MARRSLARELLAWQLAGVALLLVTVAALAAVQSDTAFRSTQGARMLSVAEDVAATAGVRASLSDPAGYEVLPTFAESARTLSGASAVVIVDADRVVRTSPDPAQVGTRLELGASTALAGRAWVGTRTSGRTVVAQVPVLDDDGRVVGAVSAEARVPAPWSAVFGAPGPALGLLAAALVLGVVGSLLLARRVKRQTLGLEPAEIVELVERREAMLHGVKEGVVGLDRAHRITLVNDAARDMLALRAGVGVGADVTTLGLDERLRDVLTGRAAGADQVVLRDDRVLVLNRRPVAVHGEPVGAVVTLRDHTEPAALRDQLDATRQITDGLRAQAHEFANRMHTITGLIELGEYDEAVRYVQGITRARERQTADTLARVADPAVAALLVAKTALAAERGVTLRLADDSRLDPVDEALSTDLVTVLGNLVDNAMDALAGPGTVRVALDRSGDAVRVVVRDSGPGVASDLVDEVFRFGFTTKAAERGDGRGLGLALARQACLARGGSIGVHNADGAVFTASLPVRHPGGVPR